MNTRDESVVLLGDIAKFFSINRKKIGIYSAIIGLGVSLLSLLLPVQYEVAASFKDGINAPRSLEGVGAFSMLMSLSPSRGSTFAGIAKSKTLLEKVCSDTGILIAPKRKSLPSRIFQRIKNNLSSDENAQPETIFSGVIHGGEETVQFSLKRKGEHSFLVRTSDGTVTEHANGDIVSLPGASFVVDKFAQASRGWITYEITPFLTHLKGLQKSVLIEQDKSDPSIAKLKILDTSKHRAIRLLNAMMNEYTGYLEDKRKKIIVHHINNLYEHKAEVEKHLDETLQKHMKLMKENVDQAGFLEYELELTHLYKAEQELATLLIDTELLLEDIENPIILSPNIPPVIHTLQQNAFDIEKQLLSLESELPEDAVNTAPENLFTSGAPLLSNEKKFTPERYTILSKALRGVYEKVDNQSVGKYSGLDFETARSFYLNMLGNLQEIYSEKDALALARTQLGNNFYDLRSLGALSKSLEGEALTGVHELLKKKENKEYYSTKDRERIEHELAVTARALTQSIEEKQKLLSRKEKTTLGEIFEIKKTLLHLAQKQLALSETQKKDAIQVFKTQLQSEKKMLLAKLDSIKEKLRKIPEKWKESTQMKMSFEMHSKLISNLVQYIESQNMSSKLNTADSNILDLAYAHPKPKKSPVILFFFGGGTLGGIVVVLTLFLVSLSKGLPLSAASVLYKRFAFCGKVRPTLEKKIASLTINDFDILRRIRSEFSKKVILFANGFGPDIAPHIAHLLRKEGQKVLLVQTEKRGEFGPECDRVSLEEHGLFLSEHLRSVTFEKKIEEWKKLYDTILLASYEPLASDSQLALLPKSDTVIIGFRDEPWSVCEVLTKDHSRKAAFYEY